MDQLKAKIREGSTEQILDCIVMLGGGQLSVDKRMARAALIDVYIERTSPEEGDALMDVLGM
jgi:hypothetical protein